ncbi:TonB-dependent receptor [Labilibacter sediminis]|nr:TonB-dependent receptor [Labilibacter sediminis]
MKSYILNIILIFCFPALMLGQKTISGIVTDESATTIPGVTVAVKGTNNGTITDMNGQYRLENVDDKAVLVFSFIGLETQQISVGSKSAINVVLRNADVELDQVVVVGYGTEKKKDLTGAIASLSSEDLQVAPAANFDQALAGRISGVQVTSSEGTPGSALNIVIRGGNSITGDNSPLYVVDGIPLEDFDPSTINSEDIESFDVLKDASATAIYGSRGANGVIVITTKSGRDDGKTDVTASAAYGVQYVPSRLEVLSPYEYVRYKENQTWAQQNWTRTWEVNKFYNTWIDPELYRDMEGTDWQSDLFRAAPIQRYNIGISGGSKSTSIYYSGQYLDQDGTLINTGFQKINNNLKINHKLSEKTQLLSSLQFSNSKRKGPSMRESQYSSIIREAVRFRPIEPIIDDGLGEGGYDPTDTQGSTIYPPVQNLENIDQVHMLDVIRGTTTFLHDFNPYLKLRVSGNYQLSTTKASIFYGEDTRQGTNTDDRVTGQITQNRVQNLSSSNTLTYKRKFGAHKTTLLGGVEASQYKQSGTWLQNSNIPTDDFGIDNIGIGITPKLAQTSFAESYMLSYFGRVNYDYKGKYLLTVNFRADGSSKFAEGNKWGYFPSFSGAWHIGEEKFLKRNKLISSLKLRAGWGLTGNNRINNLAAFNTLAVNTGTGYIWGDDQSYNPGAIQNNIAVPDLRWETTSQSNIGLDFSVLNYRLRGTVDYYHKMTRDLLLNADMSLSTGFSKVMQNVGTVQNQGLEFSFNSTNFKTANFKWTSNFNIAFNKNKTVALNEGQDAIYTDPNIIGTLDEHQYITKVGQPVGMMYGLEFDGVYQVDDFYWDNASDNYVLKEGVPDNGSPVSPGSIKFIDQNGDGTINSDDRVVIGNPHPKHFGGLSNEFKYKGFDCQVLFQWSYGFDVLNVNKMQFASPFANNNFNGFSDFADAWTPFNNDTDVHATYYAGVIASAPAGNLTHSGLVEDGSYLRLKNVTLGYTLPKRLLSKLRMKQVRLYVSGQNLYTWTNYTGYDPDVSIKKSALTPNADYSSYPQSITVMGGIDIKF